MSGTLTAMKMEPFYSAKPWGGRRLETLLGKRIPDGAIGESWEISVHPAGPSRIAEGSCAGRLFSEALGEHGEEILGPDALGGYGGFPLLVHACGDGVLLYEVQQSSDITYRVFDWNRLDDRGKPRELHLEQAARSIRADVEARITRREPGSAATLLSSTSAFRLSEVSPRNDAYRLSGGRCRCVTVVGGEGVLRSGGADMRAVQGESIVVPAILDMELTGRTLRALVAEVA